MITDYSCDNEGCKCREILYKYRTKTVMEEQQENALRYNDGKTRYNLVPPEWIDWIANIFEKGAQKYAPHNWKKSRGTKDHGLFVTDREDSLMRHLQAYRRGEWKDPETEMPHLGHVAWNALCIVWYEKG